MSVELIAVAVCVAAAAAFVVTRVIKAIRGARPSCGCDGGGACPGCRKTPRE